jgi:hypothetical protein
MRASVDALAMPAELLPTVYDKQQHDRSAIKRGRTADMPRGGGIFGSLSKAANLVLYVAGSPAAVERRAREMGDSTAIS